MLARIRARGVVIGLSPQGGLMTSGQMSPAQRKYLQDHEAELLALLWTEDGTVECIRCTKAFDCHQEGRYAMFGEGLLCGACFGLSGRTT